MTDELQVNTDGIDWPAVISVDAARRLRELAALSVDNRYQNVAHALLDDAKRQPSWATYYNVENLLSAPDLPPRPSMSSAVEGITIHLDGKQMRMSHSHGGTFVVCDVNYTVNMGQPHYFLIGDPLSVQPSRMSIELYARGPDTHRIISMLRATRDLSPLATLHMSLVGYAAMDAHVVIAQTRHEQTQDGWQLRLELVSLHTSMHY